MNFYNTLYTNICNKGKYLKEAWGYGSGLHRHHIIPRHMGGEDVESNYTYLSVREHVAAHFLLWKIHNNPNDIRSMYMLGAHLTPQQRRVSGKFCHSNKIGIHAADSAQKAEWGQKSYDLNIKNSTEFAYWASPAGRKERASLGGKASLASGNNAQFAYWMSPEGRHQRAKLGAAAAGRKPATNDKITKRFKTEDLRNEFLQDNPDWRVGVHWQVGVHRKANTNNITPSIT